MGKSKESVNKISTSGLTGCYGYLITGEYLQSSFYWLEHQLYSDDPDTSSPSQLLYEIMERFVEKMKKKLAKIFPSSNIDLREISNLVLLVADGVQEFPDDVRNALALLQQLFHQELLGLFSNDPEAYHLMQQLQGRTTITAPVGYTISDETEDLAYVVGKS
jgi:hypothetical protein